MQTFQISLAAARVNARLTQDDVAQKMRVSKRTVINWEKGVVMPSAATLHMLSEIYSIPVDGFSIPQWSTLSEWH